MNDLASFHLLKRDNSPCGEIPGFRFRSRIRAIAHYVMLSAFAATFTIGIQSAQAAGELSLPVWEEVFNPDGSYKDQMDDFGLMADGGNGVHDYLDLGGLDAVFVEDNISDDLATDMSLHTGANELANDVIFNGTVSALYDLGNVHVLAKRDSFGDLQLYAGVELLSPVGDTPPPDTFVEFEFTQVYVHAIGVNEPIRGERTDGDLQVRVNFSEGALSSVLFQRWQGDLGYQIVETAIVQSGDAAPCHGGETPYVFCQGSAPIEPPVDGYEVWDLDGNIVASTAPDGFVEVGLDVMSLVGANPEFTSILVRTPEDIAFGSFRALGHWAMANAVDEEN